MTDTLIIKTLTEEKSRILTKAGGKNLVLTITTKSGETLEFKTNAQGAFYKEPEILDGNLKIGVADINQATSTTNDVDGTLTVETKQPIYYKYIDPAEVSTMRWDFDIVTTNQVEPVTPDDGE